MTILSAETIIRADCPTIYLATIESPLISDMTPHVEIVIEGAGVRFKPYREV